MWVERDAVEYTGAEPRIYRTSGESGREKTCAFCGECGTQLYHAGGGVREEGNTTLSMKAGTLEDTCVVVPTSHLSTKRAHLTRETRASRCASLPRDAQRRTGVPPRRGRGMDHRRTDRSTRYPSGLTRSEDA